MKKQLAIMVTCVLFLTLSLSGCEQFVNKPDHVEVNVMVAVSITVVDENYNPVNINCDGTLVKIEVSKTGENQYMFERYVQNGYGRASCSYTLTQGQSINCIATILYTFINGSVIEIGNSTLTWETAYANMDLGGVYNWYPYITITIRRA